MISQIISIALHRCNCTADNFNCNGNHFTDHNFNGGLSNGPKGILSQDIFHWTMSTMRQVFTDNFNTLLHS